MPLAAEEPIGTEIQHEDRSRGGYRHLAELVDTSREHIADFAIHGEAKAGFQIKELSETDVFLSPHWQIPNALHRECSRYVGVDADIYIAPTTGIDG